jgi:hypothetical protein
MDIVRSEPTQDTTLNTPERGVEDGASKDGVMRVEDVSQPVYASNSYGIPTAIIAESASSPEGLAARAGGDRGSTHRTQSEKTSMKQSFTSGRNVVPLHEPIYRRALRIGHKHADAVIWCRTRWLRHANFHSSSQAPTSPRDCTG